MSDQLHIPGIEPAAPREPWVSLCLADACPMARGEAKRSYRSLYETFFASREWRDLPAGDADAQALALYLAVGPIQRSVPGVLLVGEGELADRLRWPVGTVRRTLKALEDIRTVETDLDAQLLWLPWRYDHEPPANPNQVKGWRSTFERWPAGDLARKVRGELRAKVDEYGDTKMLEAFDGLPNPYGNGSLQPLGKPSGVRVAGNGSGEGYRVRDGGNQRFRDTKKKHVVVAKVGESERENTTACESVDNSLSNPNPTEEKTHIAGAVNSALDAIRERGKP